MTPVNPMFQDLFFPTIDKVSGDEPEDPVGKVFAAKEVSTALSKGGAAGGEMTFERFDKLVFQDDAEQVVPRTRTRSISDAAWDDPIASGAPLSKDALTFKKGTRGYELGVTRIEEATIDGYRWLRGFNGKGELVDARLLG